MNQCTMEFDDLKWEMTNSESQNEINLARLLGIFNWKKAEFVMARYLSRCMYVNAGEFLKWRSQLPSTTISKWQELKTIFIAYK